MREHLRCNTWGRLKVCALVLGVYLHLCNEFDFCELRDEVDTMDGLGEMHLLLVHDFNGVVFDLFVAS